MYGKIFRTVYYGSLAEMEDARELFICLCVHCDKTGFIDMNLTSFGQILRWPKDRLEAAATVLLSPDPNSGSPEEEGRRILSNGLVARGIKVVNYEKYRAMQTEEDKKEYMQRYYETVLKPKRRKDSTNVKERQKPSSDSIQAEAEAEVEVEAKKKKDTVPAARSRFTPPTLEEVKAYCLERKNSVDPQAWMDHYESNGWRVGKATMKSWKAAVRTWEHNDIAPQNGAQKRPQGPGSDGGAALRKAQADRLNWERENQK